MEDQANKQEPATPYKLSEARKKGQIAKSPEFIGILTLIAWTLALAASSISIAITCRNIFSEWYQQFFWYSKSTSHLMFAFSSAITKITYAILPSVAFAAIFAVTCSIIINGPVFSGFPIKPDFTRLNPAQGFKKLFSKKALIELLKLVIKLILLATAAYQLANLMINESLRAQTLNQMDVGPLVLRLLKKALLAILAIMLVTSAIDFWYSRWDFARQMKMSRRDLRDEIKRREGDQDIKSKRKKIQADLLKKTAAIGRVKEADLIITNPTHFAVALQYRAKKMALPIVLASGRGLLAKMIVQSANRHRVRIYRRPPLARYIFKKTTLGNPIPIERQKEVALLYRDIINNKNNKVFS